MRYREEKSKEAIWKWGRELSQSRQDDTKKQVKNRPSYGFSNKCIMLKDLDTKKNGLYWKIEKNNRQYYYQFSKKTIELGDKFQGNSLW